MEKERQDFEIVKGTTADLAELAALYDDLTDYLENNMNYPGWRKGLYPARVTAENGISANTLYVLKQQGTIAAAVVLNYHQEEMYPQGKWQADEGDNEFYCVHTLCVHPRYLKHGFARLILEFAKEQARRDKKKSLRLDVADQNTPAIALYEKSGFQLVGKVQAEFPGSPLGRSYYRLYEYIL